MEQEQIDIYDEIISNLRLTDTTKMDSETLRGILHKAFLLLNLSYVLADVTDQLLQDMESELLTIQMPYKDPASSYLKELKKLIKASRKWAYHVSREMYHKEGADKYVCEADWWYNMILLITDRTAGNQLKTKQVINWLTAMPSMLNMFDVKDEDFQRL